MANMWLRFSPSIIVTNQPCFGLKSIFNGVLQEISSTVSTAYALIPIYYIPASSIEDRLLISRTATTKNVEALFSERCRKKFRPDYPILWFTPPYTSGYWLLVFHLCLLLYFFSSSFSIYTWPPWFLLWLHDLEFLEEVAMNVPSFHDTTMPRGVHGPSLGPHDSVNLFKKLTPWTVDVFWIL